MSEWLMSAFDHVVIPEPRHNAELEAKLAEYELELRSKLKSWCGDSVYYGSIKRRKALWFEMAASDCMRMHCSYEPVYKTNGEISFECYLITKSNGFAQETGLHGQPKCSHDEEHKIGTYPDHPYFYILLKICREIAVELNLREPEPAYTSMETALLTEARTLLKSKPIPDSVFHRTAEALADVVSEKNLKYGDSFSVAPRMLELLYPDGVRPEQYKDMLTIVRMLDKMKRIATDKDPNGESPYQDIAGYALLKLAAGVSNDDE